MTCEHQTEERERLGATAPSLWEEKKQHAPPKEVNINWRNFDGGMGDDECLDVSTIELKERELDDVVELDYDHEEGELEDKIPH
ncbi:hypothetical protein NDU88_002055 [Pleurodeles waltl]|uniref:Uncharacterized protein n=1 Tax=Pleurodeles waltl TaxID=8319 RepID=A0AAV7T1C4_PLEWA|nr:hypothetical protein NDU88_002055 [Pleurodeles waltl]